MPVDVVVPKFGESVAEVVLVQWQKKSGELVRRDDPLVEVETEKATENIVAPVSGKLTITQQGGTRLPVGAVVGRIEEADVPSPAETEKPPPRAAESAESDSLEPSSATPAVKQVEPARPRDKDTPAPPMSPAARVHVAERGLDPHTISATGRGGVILKEDVLAHPDPVKSSETPSDGAASTSRSESRQKMSPLRRRIADRLVASQRSTATLTTFNEADMSAIIDLRSRFKERFEKEHGVSLGFMSFFVKAVVEGLKQFPVVNARIDGDEIVYPQYYDIGVAVGTDRGLMVPVIRSCDLLSFADIEKTIADLAKRARDGKIKPDDLAGGTFTITNGGVFGSMMSTPIVNPPQSAILGMHAIQKRPIALGEQVVIRPMMYLALSYDHRLIDGREAVQFLVRVKECVENPGALLLDVF